VRNAFTPGYEPTIWEKYIWNCEPPCARVFVGDAYSELTLHVCIHNVVSYNIHILIHFCFIRIDFDCHFLPFTGTQMDGGIAVPLQIEVFARLRYAPRECPRTITRTLAPSTGQLASILSCLQINPSEPASSCMCCLCECEFA